MKIVPNSMIWLNELSYNPPLPNPVSFQIPQCLEKRFPQTSPSLRVLHQKTNEMSRKMLHASNLIKWEKWGYLILTESLGEETEVLSVGFMTYYHFTRMRRMTARQRGRNTCRQIVKEKESMLGGGAGGVVLAVRTITVKVRSIYAAKFFKASAESRRPAGSACLFTADER